MNKVALDSGLKDKGVTIRFLKELKFKNPPKGFLRQFYDNIYINTVRKGGNAFFAPTGLKLPKGSEKVFYIKPNSVILPEKKILTGGFHELGHALNYNFSKFGKFLQHCRPISMFGPIILGMYGAFSKKSKQKDEDKELTALQKTNNFVRDNAGKLAFGMSLPMLLEEGMATIKGQNLAKKVLSPELFKKVKKANAIAYCTYLAAAVFASLAVTTAVKVKDAVMERKGQKAIEKALKNAE